LISKRDKPVLEKEKEITLLTYKEYKESGLLDEIIKMYKYRKTQKYVASQDPLMKYDIFNNALKANWRTYKNLENTCIICGSNDNVQQHHVKHIKKGKVIGFTQVMKQLNRLFFIRRAPYALHTTEKSIQVSTTELNYQI
jgi:hypothetical protein